MAPIPPPRRNRNFSSRAGAAISGLIVDPFTPSNVALGRDDVAHAADEQLEADGVERVADERIEPAADGRGRVAAGCAERVAGRFDRVLRAAGHEVKCEVEPAVNALERALGFDLAAPFERAAGLLSTSPFSTSVCLSARFTRFS